MFLSILLLLILNLSCSIMPSKTKPVQSAQQIKQGKGQHHTKAGFQNHPYVQSPNSLGLRFYMRRAWASLSKPKVPSEHVLSEKEALQQFYDLKGSGITWLGHASFLLKISGQTILTDPFLSKHASPFSWVGPKRFVPPGISLKNLPQIDIILVSHNHYDHLDDETIRSLKNKDAINVVVPLGLKKFFTQRGYTNVIELDWNEIAEVADIEFTALPAVHNSSRSTKDLNKTLWASWKIQSTESKLLFIGDTAYSDTIFKEIGKLHGPFNHAVLPIGAYEPRELLWMSHVNPEESVKIGLDVKAKNVIASHWGTINLSDEPAWEPAKRFKQAGADAGYKDEYIWVMKIGGSRSIDITD